MGAIHAAQLDRSLVVAQVVVALGQAEASLGDVDEIPLAVFEVGHDVRAEEDADTDGMEVGSQRAHVGTGLDSVDPGQPAAEWGGARGGDLLLIHPRGEVAAGDAGRRVVVSACGGRLEQRLQELLVANGHLVEGSPRSVLGRHGVLGEPSAVGETEEVLSGIDGRVAIRRRERGVGGHREGTVPPSPGLPAGWERATVA